MHNTDFGRFSPFLIFVHNKNVEIATFSTNGFLDVIPTKLKYKKDEIWRCISPETYTCNYLQVIKDDPNSGGAVNQRMIVVYFVKYGLTYDRDIMFKQIGEIKGSDIDLFSGKRMEDAVYLSNGLMYIATTTKVFCLSCTMLEVGVKCKLLGVTQQFEEKIKKDIDGFYSTRLVLDLM